MKNNKIQNALTESNLKGCLILTKRSSLTNKPKTKNKMRHEISELPEQLSENEPLVFEQGEEFELKRK